MKIERSLFLSVLDTTKPALSGRNFIPVLSCFCFDEGRAYAFDDLISISMKLDVPIRGAVRGNSLLALLQSTSVEQVDLRQKDNVLNIGFSTKISKSEHAFSVLPTSDFVFQDPDPEVAGTIVDITDAFLAGMDLCMLSATADTSHPDRMGVALVSDGETLDLFSTDDTTISRARVPVGRGGIDPKGTKIATVLPLDFCKILSSICKGREGDRSLLLGDAFALALVGEDIQITTKLIPGLKPLEYYGSLVSKQLKALGNGPWQKIGDEIKEALARSKIIADSVYGQASFDVADSELTVLTKSEWGDRFEDHITLEAAPDAKALFNPHLIARAFPFCDELALLNSCLFMRSEEKGFLYLAAPDRSPEKK